MQQSLQSLPLSIFETASLSPKEQFSAWCESIAPLFDAAPLGDSAPPSFFGEFKTYVVGPLMMGGTAFDGHRYGRTAARVRRDSLNHYHLTLHLAGGFVGRCGEHDIVVGPGDITLLDFGRPIALESRQAELLAIGVPREILQLSIPERDHHGLVLRGDSSLGGLLADHIHSLVARLPGMTVEEAIAASSGVAGMIAACFQPSAATFANARPELQESLSNRIRQHIARNLHKGPLSSDDICVTFHISRASLYRLFGPFGGVSAYVLNQRLSRVFTALMNPLQNHRKISEIAYEWGFGSEAHFSRAFRKTFGMTPRETRSIMRETASAHAGLQEWLPRLRRP
jgi:AraC-like DNA-binding protein